MEMSATPRQPVDRPYQNWQSAQHETVHFWFSIDVIQPNNDFDQRYDEDNQWLPPRPRGSNVLYPANTHGRYYEYRNRRVHLGDRPRSQEAAHYKTFSFYHNRGVFWIYPSDARQKVGDGTGNLRIHGDDTENDSNGSSSEDNGTDQNMNQADWTSLSFQWPMSLDNTGLSYATVRARRATIYTQRPNQHWVQQLLPSAYHAPPERYNTVPGQGGLVGELPIMIALIAFSVRPDQVHHTLLEHMQRTYHVHDSSPGEGCKIIGFDTFDAANRSQGLLEEV